MVSLRHGSERGQTRLSWLDSRHSFSFGDYFDPTHERFRSLRVLNEDFVAPGKGFGMHPHRDMEILTLVLSGTLEHADNLGNGSKIVPGDVQRMTAGRGIMHSEYNPSPTEPVHLMQIWLLPERRGLEPGYEQRSFPVEGRQNRWQLVAARDGRDGSVTVHQDVSVYLADLTPGTNLQHSLATGRGAWLQLARGEATVNGQQLRAGDAVSVTDADTLTVSATTAATLLLFDLA